MIATPVREPAPGAAWRRQLTLLTLAHAIGTLNFMTLLAMAPAVQVALGLSRTEFGLLATAYWAGLLACALPFGWVVDRIGVRWALVTAHLVMASATLLLTRAETLAVAAGCAGALGVGYAFINPATAKAVLLWFPVQKRGTAMGIKQTGVPLGGAVAAGAGALGASLGWQEALWMVATVTLAGGAFHLSLGDGPKAHGEGVPRATLADFAAVLRDRNLMVFNVTGAIFSAAQSIFFTYLALFIRDATQAGLAVASLSLGFAHVGSAVGRVTWGLASDRLLEGRRKMALVMIGASASALLVTMLAVRPGWGIGLGAGLALLLGLTLASHAGLYQTAAVEAVDPRMAGAAIGYSMTAVPLGGMLGPPLFGGLVDRTGTYGSGWLLTAALLLASTLLFARGFHERGPSGRTA